jgi:5-formyltetrahydrofolate cyclo-ligase
MSEWSGRHTGKDALRERIWTLLEREGASVGHAHGHIPDFVGADRAAERLAQLPIWRNAQVVKCNPDAPQAPVRLRALQEGKVVYMAVPRLRDERCFVELHRDVLSVPLDVAAETKGALAHGKLVAFDEMQPIDLVLVGCVAVTRSGGRTGKGAGFADLELGMLRQLGLVSSSTPIATTVHPLQVVDEGELPMTAHDSALDWIVTPDEVIETHTSHPQPNGILWEAIREEQFESIPILRKLRTSCILRRACPTPSHAPALRFAHADRSALLPVMRRARWREAALGCSACDPTDCHCTRW